MRHILIAGLLFSAALGSLQAIEPDSPPIFTGMPGVPGNGFEAAWLGELWAPSGKLRVFVRLFEADGRLTGSMDSLDERVKNMEIQSALTFGPQLRFELSRPEATFEGQLNAEGSELTGRWKQDGKESWLVLRRLEGHPGKR
ncbi:MAG: hypothetical protein O2795_08420 [Acidobacteria bacterium]|nr:hypothetical protein [Acidobacteriota bacterium]